MKRTSLPCLLAVLAVPALSGCVSRSEVAEVSPVVGKPCPEERVLVVRNNTGAEVEIVESRTGSGARTVIAFFPPGTHELRIRNEYQYSYSARLVAGGTTLATTSRNRVRDRAVTLSRECR